MVFKRLNQIVENTCLQCYAVNTGDLAKRKHIKCCNCSLLFDIVETNRVVEIMDIPGPMPGYLRPLMNKGSLVDRSIARLA
ncbi:hypothetical protein BJY01DRAFT_210367 [Aspergillus pseudoustus]|uniref:Uncharacterized protein n=1 Tax=Aspergillus pseudoustus TaxID=1810923 RepID=A0ABR4KC18_9EURO